MTQKVKHLPYQINEQTSRFDYYETYWKQLGFDLLERHFVDKPKNARLLDYGCGRGETLQMAVALGYTCVGTDVDPTCLELSAKFAKIEPLDMNDPLRQFGERSFDVVTCFHVLEHVDSPQKILANLSHIARKYVVIAVPNLQTIRFLFRRNDSVHEVNEGHHQSWDFGHFRNLAERYCDLELVEWGHDAVILPVISNWTQKLFGKRSAIFLETKVMNRVLPFYCQSVLGLFKVKR
jgi:SAM-dependent methyltransferase